MKTVKAIIIFLGYVLFDAFKDQLTASAGELIHYDADNEACYQTRNSCNGDRCRLLS